MKKKATRSARAAGIPAAATRLFLRKGYLDTSMEEIADRAGVSKQTIYKHFRDKEKLFAGLIAGTTQRAAGFVESIVTQLSNTNNVEKDLLDIAERYVATVFNPAVLRLRRLVVMESVRFPGIARSYYRQAPQRTVESLAEAFRTLGERGLLRLDNPELAAMQFAGMIVMLPLDKTMFGGRFKAIELKRYAEAGVRVFLAAYGVPRGIAARKEA